jgi:signal transduction histidine kinase/DNA-binding response OmpR family regulator
LRFCGKAMACRRRDATGSEAHLHLPLSTLLALAVLACLWFLACLAVIVLQNRRQKALRRQASEALSAESRRADRFARLHEEMGGALLTVGDDGLVASANAEARRLFSAGGEGLAQRSLATLLPAIARDWPPSGSGADGRFAVVETEGHDLDGRVFPAEVRLSRIGDGEPGSFALLVIDMTAQAAASDRLREAQARLRDAIEALPDAFVLYDAQDRLVLCNRRYRELYTLSGDIIRPGVTFEEIIRKGIELGQYEGARADPEGWLAERLRMHRDPPPEPIDQKLGDGRWLRVFERRMSDGQTVGFRIDITDERAKTLALEDALARAEEADRAKSDFLAMMSHEIRTPLNAVLGLLDLISHTGLTPRQRDYTRTAREAALALLQILDDILDFSRLEARRLEFVDAAFDPRALVEAVRALFAPQATEKGLDFKAQVTAEVPAALVGDAGRIRQVLINLVANAMKWTADGSVSVELSSRPETANDDAPFPLRLVVDDSGPGIVAADRERIFAKFTTLGRGTGGSVEGVGLGLAICREIVEAMGGRIEVADRPGGGSRFVVDLALARADGPCAAPQRAEPELAGLRVLIAEDNPANRMVAGEMLARWGCIHGAAETGEAALDLLDREPYDLVLMDLSMPGMGGVEATRRIRESGRAHAGIPVIALTAHALVAERDRALAAGMSDFVTKPVDADVLREAIAKATGRSFHEPGESAAETGETADFLADLSSEARARVVERCRLDLLENAGRLDETDGSAATLGRIAHVLAALTETFGLPDLATRARRVETAVTEGRIVDGEGVAGEADELARHARAAALRLAKTGEGVQV